MTRDSRRLLSTVTYTLTSTSTAIYLEATLTAGEVDVRSGSPTGTLLHHFSGAGDQDVIISPYTGVTFYQQVPAVNMPTGGILVSAGGSGTLEIDAGALDQQLDVTASTSTSATITVTDATDSVAANSYFGAGITHLNLVTNNVVATDASGGTIVNVPNLASATHLKVETGLGTYDTINLGGGDNSNLIDAVVHTGAGHDAVLVTSYDGSDVDGVSTATVDMGAGTGTGDGLGLGNTLHVGSGGTVTLDGPAKSPRPTIHEIPRAVETGF